jgi:8-oxo-dGTP pyrophosphatase MutT (NUDIX family)
MDASSLRSTRAFNLLMQRYWRMTRSVTLGAQGVVIDAQSRVLLGKHTYRPGWHFPGGGVERHETATTALERELEEEAGVVVASAPQLFGLYANFRAFPSDHVALFLVKEWTQPVPPVPNREIAAHRFFAKDELPDDIHQPTARRIREVFDGVARDVMW